MYEYAFLFAVGLVWLCFAVVQDVRTREIANWLNFSLLALALFYRALYAHFSLDWNFFYVGLGGTLFFMCMAYVLYYSRAFAGGDAKLLMALGPVLPFNAISDYFTLGLGFIFALFLLGSVYGLVYTGGLVFRQPRAFSKSFRSFMRSSRTLVYVSCILGIVMCALFFWTNVLYAFIFLGAFVLLPFLYCYGKAVEAVCFVKKVSASHLTEGDWLLRDVRVRGRVIKATLHGLSVREIALLRKARASVYIKEGIPFSPAFLLAFLAMVFYVLW